MSIIITCDPFPKGRVSGPSDLACTVESGTTKRTTRMQPGQKRSYELGHKNVDRNDWLLLRRGAQDQGIMIENRAPAHLTLEEVGADGTELDNTIKAGATRPLAPKIKRVRMVY